MPAWKVGHPDHIILCLSSVSLPVTMPEAAGQPVSLLWAPDSARSCSSVLAINYWASWRIPESSSKDPLLKYLSSDRSSWTPLVKTVPSTQYSLTLTHLRVSHICSFHSRQLFPYISLSAWNFLYGLQSRTVKKYCALSSNLEQEAKSMIIFYQSIQFSVIFRQHKKKSLTSPRLGSYFLLKDLSRLNFALKVTFNQHLHCLTLHCGGLMIWLINPIFPCASLKWGASFRMGDSSPPEGLGLGENASL